MAPTPQDPHDPRSDLYVDVDSARLRYRDEGRGPPLLLLHGWTLDLDLWEPQVAALADRFRILRLDRRGHGLSSGRPGLAHDVTDAIALCRHLGVARIGLVGMSQGARVAQVLATSAPSLVACVILDGPPGPPVASPPPGTAPAAADVPFNRYRELVRTEGLDAFRREWSRHPLTQLKSGDDYGRRLLAQMLARYPGTDLVDPPTPAAAALAPIAVPVAATPPTLHQPVLIINGALDLESRRTPGDALARTLPQGRRELIAGAGHIPNLDRPAAYNALLGAFFTEHLLSSR